MYLLWFLENSVLAFNVTEHCSECQAFPSSTRTWEVEYKLHHTQPAKTSSKVRLQMQKAIVIRIYIKGVSSPKNVHTQAILGVYDCVWLKEESQSCIKKYPGLFKL